MKKIFTLLAVIMLAYTAKSQADGALFSFGYNHYSPASDTAKKHYTRGGGLDAAVGFRFNNFFLTGTAAYDLLKVNPASSNTSKDGWLNAFVGVRYYTMNFKNPKKKTNKKSLFFGANYGGSINNFTARLNDSAPVTPIWSVGGGFHFSGLEIGYFNQNMKNIAYNSWLSMHQIKLSFTSIY